jgi:glucose/mannose-6-phosphate isomerase
MITRSDLEIYDGAKMFDVLADFSGQIKEAYSIGEGLNLPVELSNIQNIIITGLGGSAIGGDLLRSYLQYENKLPVQINRNYFLPSYADENTLLIASSYSGETEETLSAYEDAVKKKCKIVCISSGGKLSVLAKSEGHLLITVPKGYQPRCALAYSFFPLLMLLGKLGFVSERNSQILDLIEFINGKKDIYTSLDSTINNAISNAEYIKGRIPVIYSSNDLLDIVNLRWRGQFSENSKSLAFGNYFPEMNHNEIVGWQENSEILRNFAVLFLKDKEDNPRILKRLQVTKELLGPYRGIDIEIESEGNSRLERIFDLVYLGDWISFYLAILYKTDPSPIEKINILKNKLMES